MIGLDRKSSSQRDSEATWPLTVVLLALGGTISWIAFRFLDVQDPRLLHNPWTYAIATPVVLLALSAVLGSIASRVVERSMQIAFLLSVMIHLLMLVYATNIVIFSRMWPDVFEALAEQREMLQRQQHSAPRYHNLSATRAERRPDHLRYVPTQHQASEQKETNNAALQLAASHRSELVTPQPDVQRSPQPHLIPREKPQLTPPQSSDRAASLSRSELSSASRLESSADTLSAPVEPNSPEPIRPTEANVGRQSSRKAELHNEFAAASSNKSAVPTIPNRRPLPARTETSAISSLKPERQNLQPLTPKGRPVDVPEPQPATQEQVDQQLAAIDQQLKRSATVPANLPLSPLVEASSPQPFSPSTNSIARRADAKSELMVPQPSAGDSHSALARDAAGGRPSAPAPRAMPIEGIASLATPESVADITSSLSSLENRSTRAERSSTRLPDIGLPQSPLTNSTPNFGSGLAGQSTTSQLQRAENGKAAIDDVAGLTGAGSALQKSAVGVAAASGPISLPAEVEEDGGGTEASARLAADTAGAERRRPSSATPQLPNVPILSAPATFATNGIPEGLARVAAITTPAEFGQIGNAPARPRQASGGRPQSSSAIDVPDTSDLLEPASPGDIRISSAQTQARENQSASSIAGQLKLNVDAPIGQGGLAELSLNNGPLIPRSTLTLDPVRTAEIEAQRFTRQQVGGPLAAGSSIPLPKPAYQQRIDRLKENQVFDDGITGPQTELAIESGLEFLSKHQSPSGAWRLQDFDTKVLIRSDTAATGLSLLAFQGAGYTHQQYQYATHVGNGLQFLVDGQKPDGDLYRPQDPASDQNAWLYSHAIATLALCEAYGMTQDPALREPAQMALNFMVTSQDKERGGWRYRPGTGTDTSVSGWFMMAFKSGQLAGLDVPEPTFERIEKYLDASKVSDKQPYLFRYNPFAADTPEQRHGREPTAVMTSVGLLMRLYFGWQRDQPEMIAGAEHLLKHPPAPGTRDATLRDTYYWYYSTQVLFHMGGERWKRWNSKLHPMLIETQVTDGPNAGSWDPYKPTADLWARYGGRLYVTTLNLLSLEVTYRHLPLYDATAK
jgi:hypothetical protein